MRFSHTRLSDVLHATAFAERQPRACKTVGGSQATGALRNWLKLNADRLFWQAYQRPERTMHLIIEARIDDGKCDAKRGGSTVVAIVDRRDKDLSQLGRTLAEGRSFRLGASHDFARSPLRLG